jgi:hypothetical protein
MADIKGVAHEVLAVRMVQDDVTIYVASVPAHVIAELGVVSVYDPSRDAATPNRATSGNRHASTPRRSRPTSSIPRRSGCCPPRHCCPHDGRSTSPRSTAGTSAGSV